MSRLVVFGLVALGVSSLLFVWQFAVTGDPRINPYTLWWPYDKIGFGPGVGRTAKRGGHERFGELFDALAGVAHDCGNYSWPPHVHDDGKHDGY